MKSVYAGVLAVFFTVASCGFAQPPIGGKLIWNHNGIADQYIVEVTDASDQVTKVTLPRETTREVPSDYLPLLQFEYDLTIYPNYIYRVCAKKGPWEPSCSNPIGSGGAAEPPTHLRLVVP